jgi:hypothetical protein
MEADPDLRLIQPAWEKVMFSSEVWLLSEKCKPLKEKHLES